MMPIMTSALKTLTHGEVARGSTLLNITQQIASSVGVAIMSVILTNQFKDRPLIGQGGQYFEAVQRRARRRAGRSGQAAARQPVLQAAGNPSPPGRAGRRDRRPGGRRVSHTFWVAAVLVALALVPALFLPRKREESHLLDASAPRGAPR